MEGAVEVGIRDLRNRLSDFVARVKAGEELVVTDRGRAVARLIPFGSERPLDRLVAEGVVERAPMAGKPTRPARRVAAGGTVSDLIDRR